MGLSSRTRVRSTTMMAQFIPDLPIDAVFGNWMMRAPGVYADQVAALKARLYAALGEIEV
jgi:hypothetical protein